MFNSFLTPFCFQTEYAKAFGLCTPSCSNGKVTLGN
uniref:Uncharacterized protein n=1 Tax=Anguilla anguilla TaxID=7936 RepID=A0A0E9WUF7_ANGAN